ncbi:GCG_CRPN prefix-to-repeats domain-containing protein [uncultured Bradyrhizobium sp.]|uniref:GCG_CRPN prefix-to-repeats domain-containing protein n=1 Tax=uncultured Bradyrhizobium sp. TaxID=199684 RepID=UPI0035CB5715
MKTLFAAVLVAGTFAGFGAADAAGGCGPDFHRGPYGDCRPNGGAIVVAPRVVAPRVVVAPPVVVVPRGRVCPPGLFWRYGRCRPI